MSLFKKLQGKENGGACAKIRKDAGLYHAGGIERDHRQCKAVGRHGSGNTVSGGIMPTARRRRKLIKMTVKDFGSEHVFG